MSLRDERRPLLLQAAREVLLRFGYRKTSLEDVAREAGVSRATLYNYFPSKAELLRSIVEVEVATVFATMERAAGLDLSPEARLVAVTTARFARVRQLRKLYAVVLDVARPALTVAMAELDAFRDAQVACFAGIVADGVHSGRFVDEDPQRVGAALWAALRGMDEAYVWESRDELELAPEILVRAVARGLLVDPSLAVWPEEAP